MGNHFKEFLLTPQEKMYANHYLQTHKRLALVVILILMLFVLGFIVPSFFVQLALAMFGGRMDTNDDFVMFVSLWLIAICILAYLLPLFQFQFLMKRTSSDLYLSLPIERKRLFYVHYIIGLLFILTASLILAVPILLISFSLRFFCLVFLLLLLILMILGCCLYTFFTNLVIRCHTILDAMMICGLYTILPVFVFTCLSSFFKGICMQILTSDIMDWNVLTNINASLSYIGSLLSIPWQMNHWTQFIFFHLSKDITAQLFYLVMDLLLWILFAIVCFRNARKCFVNIRSEESEQPVKSFLTYPILIPVVTFLLVLGFGEGAFISLGLIIGLIVYLIAYFFAQRKISWDWRKIAVYVGIVLICALCHRIMLETKVFGMVTEIPARDQIGSVYVNVNAYSIDSVSDGSSQIKQGESGWISQETTVDALLKDIEDMTSYAATKDGNDYDGGLVQIQYKMKDGTFVERMYWFAGVHRSYLEQLYAKWKEKGYFVSYAEE